MSSETVTICSCLLMVVLCRHAIGAEVTLDAMRDVWLRESAPDDPAFESDLVSVWSSANTGGPDAGARRYGLVQWDVSSLSGQNLTSASLSLWVDDVFSGTQYPLKQHAYVVASGGTPLDQLTWNLFLSEKDPGKLPLETLGSFDEGIPDNNGTAGTFVTDGGASPADLDLIQAAADSPSGLLTLLFVAEEDGQEYRGDWGDVEDATQPGRLIVNTLPPACQLLGTLPDAAIGQPYSTSVGDLSGCAEGVVVRGSDCFPSIPGLQLAPDGTLTGIPRMGGVYLGALELFDPDGSIILDSVQVTLTVNSGYRSFADLDHDGDVDAVDLDEFLLDYTGPGPQPCSLTGTPQGRIAFEAVGDIWIRESSPGTTYETDLISVWSSVSNDGGINGRRYGLVEFDVGALQGETIAHAWLEMWVSDTFSGTEYPIKQKAFVIDSGGTPLTSLTWDSYLAEKDAGKTALQGLGSYDAPIPSQSGTAGTYQMDAGATANDLTALATAAASPSGRMSLVFIPDENGTDYRGDWGDGTNAGGGGYVEQPARLMVVTGSPCYIETASPTPAVVGKPYSINLTPAGSCVAPLTWQILQCDLPPGFSLNTSTGEIAGVPQLAGEYPVRVSVTDSGGGGTPNEMDLTIVVEGMSQADQDGDDDIDRDDYLLFQDGFTGPGDPMLDLCWRDYVLTSLDTLLAHGKDTYGPIQTDMLTAILELNTLTVPQNPPLLDADIRTEERPDHGRRSPAGANLWLDNALIRTLYRATDVSGDPKYAQAADDYVADTFQYAVKPTGLLMWGSHIYYNIFTDQAGGDGNGSGPHEILIRHPEWSEYFRVDPTAARAEVDAIWTWHVHDKVNGRHNRHGDGNAGLDFAFSGGSFILAFATAYIETGEQHYMDKATLVANWHWTHRDPVTGLLMDAPSAGSRYDALHSFTSVVGPFASQLLRTYEVTGDTLFRDHAVAYIKAYDQYAWDPQFERYYGMIALDGTPVPQQSFGAGYDVYQPTGFVDVWRTTMYSYEFPIAAAQAALYAYELSGTDATNRDPELLQITLRWAHTLEQAWPAQSGRRWADELEAVFPGLSNSGGTYAENYGRMISFYVNLHHATGAVGHLVTAKALARESVDRLFHNGLFRGHPSKDYYQSNDGVGYLLHALLQLDALPERWRLAF